MPIKTGEILLAVLVLFAMGFASGYKVRDYSAIKSEATTYKAQTQAVQKQVQIAQKADAVSDQQTKKVDDDVQRKLETKDAAVRSLAATVDSLQHDLAAVRARALSQTESNSRLSAEVASTTESLGECIGRYSKVAAEFDECSIQVKGWIDLFSDQSTPISNASSN